MSLALTHFRLHKLYKTKPQMNTDEHGAAQPEPQKSHHKDTKPRRFRRARTCGIFVSLWWRQDACAPRRTQKNPCRIAKDFRP